MARKRTIGTIIFGCILIVSSIFELYHIPSYNDYIYINKDVPYNIIRIRFFVSYILRVFGLASGIGVICLNNNFRKILLGLSCFSILTIFLRHTYNSFLLYTTPIYSHEKVPDFSLQSFTWAAVITSWTIEIGFSLLVIYYFTRPHVIRSFLDKQ